MMRIVKSEFVKSAVKPDHYAASSFVEFAFVGRSNVGKSSLLNSVLNRRSLAKVSGQPGKTRLINFFLVDFFKGEEKGKFMLVDLPGYGYAKVSKSEREKWKFMISDYFAARLQLHSVFVLVDIRHKGDVRDMEMIRLLRHYGKNCCVVATKSDKIAQSKQAKRLKELRQELDLQQEELIAVSALKKQGIDKILNWLENQLF